ncbi:MAG TPA: hypothetical protein VMQ93_05365 [Novosphingobium sp.]|nr:hypothetical protein [Novosphingobium sp.]
MKRSPAPLSPLFLTPALLLAATGCAASATPPPAPGGAISTLALGTYTCELPGDAAGAVGKPMPDQEFRIVNSSSYKAGGIRGSYLFVGDRVTMTGGKLKGLKLHRISTGFLRKVEADGSDGELRCVRTSHK